MKYINKAAVFLAGFSIASGIISCNNTGKENNNTEKKAAASDSLQKYVDSRLAIYEKVKLTTNLNSLTVSERKILPLLIQAAQIMDELFWKQAYPQRDSLLSTIKDEKTKSFIWINYGPWDRLNGDKPFVSGIGPKPDGGTFYPANMTKSALDKSKVKDKYGQYSVIMSDSKGRLTSIPYSVLYATELQKASSLLKQAALLAEDEGFKKYLNLRADALTTDNYTASDYAWLDMKNNSLDIIIGPIENYEDKLFNARASFEAYVLVKDKVWSKRLAKYVEMLPALQQGLPVAARYKKEKPGTDSERV